MPTMTAYTRYAIIVSGGTGSRMENPLPKQFIELKGLPILMHSISAFYQNADSINIILVLSKAHQDIWEGLCIKYNFNIPYTLVYGGNSRFESVRNGLNFIVDNDKHLDKSLIAVHDGVRPLISQSLINQAYLAAQNKGSAVPAIKSRDSIRIIDKDRYTRSIDRDSILLIQTPQVFKATLLSKAYQQGFEDSFTDDASVIEKSGYPVHIIEGNIRNIKITYPTDLTIAEMWMDMSN